MSLEQALTENTAALREVIIALAAHHVPGGAAVTGKAPAEKPAAGKAATPPATTGGALDYEKDVKPLALRVAKEKQRDGLVAILTTFGVAQANLLKPEQYGPFITACNTALAAK